jgi:hypothetical protein
MRVEGWGLGAGGWGIVTEFPVPPIALDHWVGTGDFAITPQPPAPNPQPPFSRGESLQ